MSIISLCEDTKAKLHEMMKNRAYRKANKAIEEEIEFRTAIMKCAGDLTHTRNEFLLTIHEQSKNIQEGIRLGADTSIQENLLYNAALGYMLVKEADYALTSIQSYDSVANAYNMMDHVVKIMSGSHHSNKAGKLLGISHDRNPYGYLTADKQIRFKEELLDSFFSKLVLTGDIEECLKTARLPSERNAERTKQYTSAASSDSPASPNTPNNWDVFDEDNSSTTDEDDISSARDDDDSGIDIHPPKA